MLHCSHDTDAVGEILTGEFSPRRESLSEFDTEALADRLAKWESHLPDQLRKLQPDGSLGASFWESMLRFSYQSANRTILNYVNSIDLILLFRPKSIENVSSADTHRDTRARLAADSITRMAEDLLASDMIKFAQIHLYECSILLLR